MMMRSTSNIFQTCELHIGGWTKQGFRELSRVQTLETLRVLDSFEATCHDTDVAEIAKLTKLRRLWLASRDVTDDGTAHVAKLKQLEELDLPESITPDGLKHLTGLTNLRKLSFSNIFIDEAKNPVRLSHALDLLINRQQRGLRESARMLDDSLPLEGKAMAELGLAFPRLICPR